MNIEVLFLMLDLIIVLALVILVLLIMVMVSCKGINDKLNQKISTIETKRVEKYAEKFKAISKSAERKLDGEDYSFDVGELESE
jgi:hypothetical protein